MSDPNEEPNDDLLQESENGDNTVAEEVTEEGDDQQDSLAQDDSEILNDTAGHELDETVEDAVSLSSIKFIHCL